MRGESKPYCARWGPQTKDFVGNVFGGKSFHTLHSLAFFGVDEDTGFILKTRGKMTYQRGLDILAGRGYFPVIEKRVDNGLVAVVIKKFEAGSKEEESKLSKEKEKEKKIKRYA